jgi:sigma-B regulation protein RsbU (phosphoserine phosphatase)
VETLKEKNLLRELKLKKFQFNAVYEFSSAIYSSFQIEDIIRIFFSTILAQLCLTRAFFFCKKNQLLTKRGLKLSAEEDEFLRKRLSVLDNKWFSLKTEDVSPRFQDLKSFLTLKKIHYLINISDSGKEKVFLGLGLRPNHDELPMDHIEFAFFISRFALVAIDNALLIEKMIDNKRMEHEFKIAQDIQRSLLPQQIPPLKNFDIGVIYQPINEVGGDYYDILKNRQGCIPFLVADVEGKGLPAALLAASTQAVFHSLNELYLFESGKFITKANSLIHELSRGNRLITLFWMLLDDQNKSISYVNAGHAEPIVICGEKTERLSAGGLVMGFLADVNYECQSRQFQSGDVMAIFTDGVTEIENSAEEFFGEDRLIDCIKENKHLSAQEITEKIYSQAIDFSLKKVFRDDFTLIVFKVR